MNLMELLVKIKGDNSDAEKAMEATEAKGESMSSKLKNAFGVVSKAVAAGVGASAAAITALATQSVKAYADYEQLVGGVETLFGTGGQDLVEYAKSVGKTTGEVKDEYFNMLSAQETVMSNASTAYKTAGLSANEYMETVTSFAAALTSSLDGNTKSAADKADMAITDMADNANKMGTSMEAIQNAYNGFAKQNYTMLDNLKLGYGGTKDEMERLLADAEKISGIQYDVSSYADIVDAIHVVQTEMGITGTTAKEAESTISGSLNMVKSAWSNLVVGMSDDEADFDSLVTNMVDSLSAFGNNIIPRVEVALQGIGTAIETLLPAVIDKVPGLISNFTPSLMSAVQSLITTIVGALPAMLQTILDVLPTLLQTIGSIIIDTIPTLITTLTEMLPILTESLTDICNQLAEGLPEQLPVFIENILALIQGLADSLAENASILIEAGLQLIMALAEGLINALPTLIEQVPTIITTLANIINDNAPKILQAGIQLIVMLAKGIVEAIPTLVENIPQIIEAIVAVWSAMDWISLGKNAIKGMKDGVLNMVEEVRTAGGTIKDTIVNILQALPSKLLEIGKGGISGMITGIKNMLSSLLSVVRNLMIDALMTFSQFSLVDVGKNLIQGLINGVGSMAGALLNYMGNLMSSAIDKVKGIFGVHSPSKVFAQIGEYLVDGFNIGLDTLDVGKSTSGFNDVIDNISDLQSGRMTVTTASLIGQQTEESGGISSDALTAILDKLDSLGKMQIVLDTGAFVGQTVNAYDTALGKLYTKQARYV